MIFYGISIIILIGIGFSIIPILNTIKSVIVDTDENIGIWHNNI